MIWQGIQLVLSVYSADLPSNLRHTLNFVCQSKHGSFTLDTVSICILSTDTLYTWYLWKKYRNMWHRNCIKVHNYRSVLHITRRLWCNCYRCKNWTFWLWFKSWTRQFTFHILQNKLGVVCIKLLSTVGKL